jgi:hypothetical protein
MCQGTLLAKMGGNIAAAGGSCASRLNTPNDVDNTWESNLPTLAHGFFESD